MEGKLSQPFISLKFIIFATVCTLLVLIVKVESTGYRPIIPASRNICSQNCTKMTPKLCWDGYLKRKIWKFVCENYEIKCCPGYEGPNCEKACFTCEKVNTIERRIVDIYGKIQAVEDKCTNRTVIIGGGGGPDNTGGNYNKECSCPAGPRGDQGLPGPPGPQGVQGRDGRPGQKGDIGHAGLPGVKGAAGSNGVDGLPGRPGQKGDPGRSGADGPPGYPGPAGPVGPQGPKGDEGQIGRPGRPGSASAKGDPGEPGIDGLDGLPGRPGQKGEQGVIGVPGITGQTGETGPPGLPGLDGRPGDRGERGFAGINGIPGIDGAAGSPGRPGQKGDPGIPGRDGRPGDITKIEESRVIQTLQNTIENLVTKLETVTKEVEELRIICDGIAGCRFNCTAESFKCSCGMCIPSRFRCDGFPQCPDGSDELESECDYICDAGEFKCDVSGLCIPITKQCNGVIDCADGSDESSRYCRGTINCNEGNVPCRDGSKCVAREERCDGKSDCLDGSDEDNCGCGSEEFECESRDHCILKKLVCNNYPDCPDGSDESSTQCSTGLRCPEGRIPCADQTGCIDRDQFCDGIANCFDGSDESNCELVPPTRAPPTEIPTPNKIDATPTPPKTTTTTSTTITTTEFVPVVTEEEIEGSGDLVFDRELCLELHDKFNQPFFPGGPPPPYPHPLDEISMELCNIMLLRAKESCTTGTGDFSLSAELCDQLKNIELPSMITRHKRHKHNQNTDDEELLKANYEPIKEDISFDESDLEFVDKVEVEPVAMAIYGKPRSLSACHVLWWPMLWACTYISILLM
ncbi:ammon gyrus development [Mactra antiquata]